MGVSLSLSLMKFITLLDFFFFTASLTEAVINHTAPHQQLKSKNSSPQNTVTAIFVFGDSTSDPGNNNYVPTAFRSNFAPYGQDFLNRRPTGRFTNGRLASDFIAHYVGVKDYIPPYLDPTLSMDELMTGVSFASAGSGFDPLTPKISGVIPMSRQLQYFADYRRRIEYVVGKEKAEEVIGNALFILSAGTNDFVLNYYTLPVQRSKYSVAQYQQLLLQYVDDYIKAMWDVGARRIAVAGLPPMGCLPIVITIKSLNKKALPILTDCVEPLCLVSRQYNHFLQQRLSAIQLRLNSNNSNTNVKPNPTPNSITKIGYMDVYTSLANVVHNPHTLGFEEVRFGCCGTGLLEASFLCNPSSLVCPDPNKYVFWDSMHPTEKIYFLAFNYFRPVIDRLIAT